MSASKKDYAPPYQSEPNLILTINELSEKLKVSPWTIRSWCSRKYIPYLKLRGCVRFRLSDIDAWLTKNQSPGRSLHRLKIESKFLPQP